MTNPVNFAVIGCGMIARGQHIPNIVRSKSAVLHICCDVSDAALAECRDKHGARRVTKDFRVAVRDPEVQAICLATTPKQRIPIIREAAEAGKPVYCEKPIANSSEEMLEIQKLVKDAGILFCVGHNRRCSPAMMDAHRIFRAHMEHPAPCPWRFDREGSRRPRIEGDGTAGMLVRINDDWYSWKLYAFDPELSDCDPMIFESARDEQRVIHIVLHEQNRQRFALHGALCHGSRSFRWNCETKGATPPGTLGLHPDAASHHFHYPFGN